MTAGGFEVEPGALAGHRSRVSAIAAEIQQAAAAGQATTPVGSDAFGIIGQPFALMVQDTVSTAVHNLQAVAETADQLASSVGQAGQAYELADADSADGFDAIAGVL